MNELVSTDCLDAQRRQADIAILDATMFLPGTGRDPIAEHRASLEQYEALASRLDITTTTLALAWLLSRPGVTAPVLGPRTLEQLTGSLPALDVSLDAQTLFDLDKLFPGPGEAPDAYTWS